jgi:hypothetical protein
VTKNTSVVTGGSAILTGNNSSWTGQLNIIRGTVTAAPSALTSGNISVGGTVNADSGLLTSGLLTRSVGTGAGHIQFVGNNTSYLPVLGGTTNGLTVNLGGHATPDTYDWTTPGLMAMNILRLSGPVTVLNRFDLGSTGSGQREARGNGGVVMAGDLFNSGGTWGLLASGTVTLSGNNSFNGDLRFGSSSTVIAGSLNALPPASRIVFDSLGGTFKVADGITARVRQIDIPDPGIYQGNHDAVVDGGNGTLELAGGISFPLWDPLSAGGPRLSVAGNIALPDGDHVFEIAHNAFGFGIDATFTARFTGTGVFHKTGAGTILFHGTNVSASTVDIILDDGQLATTSTSTTVGALGNGTLTVRGGTVTGSGGAISNPIVAEASLLASSLTFNGPVSLEGPCIVNASGCKIAGSLSAPAGATITLSSDYKPNAGGLTLGSPNTFDNPVDLKGAQLILAHGQALGVGTAPLTLDENSSISLSYTIPLDTQRPILVNGLPDPGRTRLTPQINGSGRLNTTISVVNSATLWGATSPALGISSLQSAGGDPAWVHVFFNVTVGHLNIGALVLDGTLQLDPLSGPPEAGRVTSVEYVNPANHPKVDIGARALVIDYDGNQGSPLSDLRAKIISAWNQGSWNGLSGITSSAAQTDARTAVGYAEASAVVPDAAGQPFWLEQQIDDTTVLLRYTLRGDFNLDGKVDFADLVRLAQSYNDISGNRIWSEGDANYDGKVDFSDLVALAQNYNSALPSGLPPDVEQDLERAFSSIPEPGQLILVAGMSLFRRTRRRGIPEA